VIALFAPGQRVVWVDGNVPHHATVLEVFRACCTVRLRKDDLVLTVPMASLRACPVGLMKCPLARLPGDAA
jgi:hypothetical protein